MTRTEIESLQVGDWLAFTIDTREGKVLPGARYSEPRKIVYFHARGYSVKGTAYACGYTTFGEGGQISFSIGEEDEYYKQVEGGR